MKKTIYMIAVGILFLASSQLASAAWNTYPSDCPLPLSVGNYTTGDGIQNGSNGCWTKTNVSASAGQTINVAVYYDNTNGSDADATVINLTQSPAGSMSSKNSSYTFSGNITSYNTGSLYLSPVSVNLSSSETLTFSQAKWFKKGSSSGVSLPGGQNGSSAFTGGLSMANIANGDWGTVIFSFSVGTTIAPQVCEDPSASNYHLGTGSCTYPPQLCKDINATNYNVSYPCLYPQAICSISNFSASRSSIVSGESSLLSWNTINCNPVTIYPTLNSVNTSGSQSVSPTSSMVYTLTALGLNGVSQTKTTTVSVTQPAVTCQDSSATNYRAVGSCTYPPQLCKDTTASNYNGTAPCTYPPQLCKDTTASNYNSVIPCTYPPQLCKDTAASNYNGSIPCTYPPQLCKDTSASNYNSAIPCIYPVTQQYCQDSSASNYRGLLPCTYPARLCMDPGASNYRSTLPCNYPVQICTDYSASNYGSALPCYYTPVQTVCRDSSASNYLGYGSCNYVQSICRDSSASNYLSSGACVYYNQTRCLDTSATNYLSYSSCIYNQSICRDTSASNYLGYGACVYNNQTICRDSSATNYNSYGVCTYSYVNKNVVTTVATNINTSSAQLNGYITNSTFYNSSTYFEYGTTVNLGQRTNSKTAYSNTNMNDIVTGLDSNTIYYFRAVGVTTSGTSYGNIEVFRTLSTNTYSDTNTTKTIYVQGNTVSGTQSPIMLNITNKYEVIGAGDLVDYTVTYKNISKSKLVKPMVQVVLPTNFTLVNASRGTYSVDTHTLSAAISDLASGEEGILYLQARVDSIPSNNAQIVTTAIIVYTNTNNAQENAMAYVLNVPKFMTGATTTGSLLGASAFFGGFFSIGLIGWLLIILLILIIILIARSYNNKTTSDSKTVTYTNTH